MRNRVRINDSYPAEHKRGREGRYIRAVASQRKADDELHFVMLDGDTDIHMLSASEFDRLPDEEPEQ